MYHLRPYKSKIGLGGFGVSPFFLSESSFLSMLNEEELNEKNF